MTMGALWAAREQARMHRSGLEVTTELADGYAREALLAASEEADLLVLGARSSGGFSRLLVGSTSLHLSVHAPCPVVVVHPQDPQPTPGGVLVGVEGERGGDDVLAFAFEAASRRNLLLQAVHAWSYPLVSGPGHAFPAVYEEEHVAAEQEQLLAEALAGTHEMTLSGSPPTGGGRAPRGGARAPTTPGIGEQAVVQHVHCPVAVVPVG